MVWSYQESGAKWTKEAQPVNMQPAAEREGTVMRPRKEPESRSGDVAKSATAILEPPQRPRCALWALLEVEMLGWKRRLHMEEDGENMVVVGLAHSPSGGNCSVV